MRQNEVIINPVKTAGFFCALKYAAKMWGALTFAYNL